MKVLFMGYNPKSSYSGGRYHAWLMAQALVANDIEVEYWTNYIPFFSTDFESASYQSKIKMDLSLNNKLFKKGEYDFIVVIPDSNWYSGLYEKALTTAYVCKSKLVLVNFESPNWYNELSPVKKNVNNWRGWDKIAKRASLILSSTKESLKYAKNYYAIFSACKHDYCYPSINTFKLGSLDIKKKHEIIIITRFDKNSLHKGGDQVLKLFNKQLKDYTLVFVSGMGMPDPTKKLLNTLSLSTGVKYELLDKISDEEKFNRIKKAELMLFLSKFEGFGYPPIESLSCNTECIVYELPVLHETCGDLLYYVKDIDIGYISTILKESDSEDFIYKQKFDIIRDKYSFKTYSRNINIIFNKNYELFEMNLLLFLPNIFLSIVFSFLSVSKSKLKNILKR